MFYIQNMFSFHEDSDATATKPFLQSVRVIECKLSIRCKQRVCAMLEFI